MKIDAENATPKYRQVYDIIKQYFEDEHYQADQKIPSESEFIERFQVSRNTVRKALDDLANEGRIYKRKGQGSFYAGAAPKADAHSYLIGVMTPLSSAYIYPQIIQGIDDVAHQLHYNIVLGTSSADPERELRLINQLLRRDIEGLLIEPAGGYETDFLLSENFQTIQNLPIPVVAMNWTIDDPQITSIALDDTEGGFRATDYLIKAGHRRVACVYNNDHPPGIQRFQGYRNALTAHGIPYDERFDKSMPVKNWGEHAHFAYLLTKELLALGEERPTAIFFFNDECALQGYAAAREAGLKIPDDISMIGFDNSDLAVLAEVPMTSVIHPKYQIGKWAAEMLFDDLTRKGERSHQQILIHPAIAVRNSVKVLT